MAQQTKRFSQQLLAGWQKGAWRGHETNPKSKSVPLLLLLLLRYLAVCPMSCVIVLPLLLVLGNSVVSFICARIDFYATFFSFSSHSLSLTVAWLCSCWLFHAHNWKFNWFTKWSRFWATASHCVRSLPFTLSPSISLSLFFLVFLSIFILVFTSGTTIFELFSGFA